MNFIYIYFQFFLFLLSFRSLHSLIYLENQKSFSCFVRTLQVFSNATKRKFLHQILTEEIAVVYRRYPKNLSCQEKQFSILWGSSTPPSKLVTVFRIALKILRLCWNWSIKIVLFMAIYDSTHTKQVTGWSISLDPSHTSF